MADVFIAVRKPRAASLLTIVFLAALTAFGGSAPRAASAQAQVENENFRIHDPSREVNENGKWWVFKTNWGVGVASSTDNKASWQEGIPIFGSADRTDYWAPDVLHIDGKWLVYYCLSSFGSQNSVIRLVSTSSIQSGGWSAPQDVISSNTTSSYNCIDPCPFLDPNTGRLWLTYGSYWNGIYVVELNRSNPSRTIGSPVWLAKSAINTAIEASAVHYRNGWYYLFANVDNCCQGDVSPYRVVMGRSRSITGPYVDKIGLDMRSGGGGCFLGGAGNFIGPGHIGVSDDQTGYSGVDTSFTYHIYPIGSTGTEARLARRSVSWVNDWPYPVFTSPLAAGIYSFRPASNTNLYMGTKNGSTNPSVEAHIDTWTWVNSQGQRWRLIPLNDGTYNIQCQLGGFYLDDANSQMKGGDYVRQWTGVDLTNNDAQRWRIIPLGGGYYEVQNVRSGLCLDMSGGATTAGTLIDQWPWWNSSGQKFLIALAP